MLFSAEQRSMTSSASLALPVVTVVTPTYNVAKYVGQAVDSVLKQTLVDFEYIVVDDGSSDSTIDVVKAHVRNDPRVRIVQTAHRGLSAARNVGISESRSPYIAYLDGDDRWHPKFLQRQVRLIESLPFTVGAVFCRSRVILENGRLIYFQWQRAGTYDFDDILIANNPARNGSSLLIRKSCFDEVGGFDESVQYVEDLHMWLRIAESSGTPIFYGSRYYLVDWRLRPGSVTRDRAENSKALDDLLAARTPRMVRMHPGLAYVRPALSALKYGDCGELATSWAQKARSVGTGRLAQDTVGLRLLFWSTMPAAGRDVIRSAQAATRELVKNARGVPRTLGDADRRSSRRRFGRR